MLQSAIAAVAGLTSIAGGAWSAVHYWKPAPGVGDVVTVVRSAGGGRPVRGATVELLTPDGAVVSTVAASEDGIARRALPEGSYQVRVRHPQLGDETRAVRVLPGETTEVLVQLAGRADDDRRSAPSGSTPRARTSAAANAVDRGVVATRRLLGRLGL
jgi:hypothetical protein